MTVLSNLREQYRAHLGWALISTSVIVEILLLLNH